MSLAGIPPDRLRAALAHPSNQGSARTALERALSASGHSATSEPANVQQRASSAAQRAETQTTRAGEYRCRIDPVGKPRQTQSDKWKERGPVVRYRAFADALRDWAASVGFAMPDSGCHILFAIPMPRSWSAKERRAMDGEPHQQRPDVDNCIKSCLDALRPDDCRVWQVSAEKRWARTGAIVFTLRK